jgi:hypothetical protein
MVLLIRFCDLSYPKDQLVGSLPVKKYLLKDQCRILELLIATLFVYY